TTGIYRHCQPALGEQQHASSAFHANPTYRWIVIHSLGPSVAKPSHRFDGDAALCPPAIVRLSSLFGGTSRISRSHWTQASRVARETIPIMVSLRATRSCGRYSSYTTQLLVIPC